MSKELMVIIVKGKFGLRAEVVETTEVLNKNIKGVFSINESIPMRKGETKIKVSPAVFQDALSLGFTLNN